VRDPLRNWGGLPIAGHQVHAPRSLDELREVVARTRHLRVLGTGHTFNDLPDSRGDLVSLAAMPRRLEVPSDGSVTVDGAARYVDLSGPLDDKGHALEAMASLPHISIVGACTTGTHGSGDRAMCLPAAVTSMDVVLASGEVAVVDASGPLAGSVVSLGALGVVAALTLCTVPRYEMRQEVYEDVSLDRVIDRLDEVTSLADSVSLFTTWRDRAFHQVWCKERSDNVLERATAADVLGGRPATRSLHPIPGHDPAACTTQLGIPGAWHERLPHFRADHVPSSGLELQSEYLIDRRHGAAALSALFDVSSRFAGVCQVSEVRSVAADELWLSPAYGRPSLAVHFTWLPDRAAVLEALTHVERSLAPFDPRPHWGKVWSLPVEQVRASYPRLADVVALRDRWDPQRTFSNRSVEALLGP
jgi:xylitol oxidase